MNTLTDIGINFFSLFGLQAEYLINSKALEDTYRDQQKQYHPDNFINASDDVKLKMAGHSANLNEAYRVLKSPSERAVHVLMLNGIECDLEHQTIHDVEFLMHQMHLREELEKITESSNLDSLEAFQEQLQQQLNEQEQKANTYIEQLVVKDEPGLVLTATKMRFLQKVLQEVDAYYDRMDDL